MQLFKGVENYFTELLFYQESNKLVKEPLPDHVDSGNEVGSESEEDVLASFILEPIIAYFDDPDCNNPVENEGEWVLIENVAFNYSLCFEDVFKFVDISSLHMPLSI